MQNTSIAWCDWTWNPIRGCSRISPGCQHCYAEALAARFARSDMGPAEWTARSEAGDLPPFHGFAEFRIIGGKREAHWTGKVELVESKLLEPLSWRRKAIKFRAEHGRRPRAFISMSDLFHEEMQDSMIDSVFAVAALTPEINYMFLTKRADRMSDYLSRGNDSSERVDQCAWGMIDDHGGNNLGAEDFREIEFPLPNVALGVSVESQKYADERIPHLLRTPAAMRFVSYEPALEAVNFRRITWHGYSHYDALSAGFDNNMERLPHLDMIIIGGESRTGARPFDIAWARSTVKQCRAAGVAPYVKQMGSKPVTMMSINAALELHRFAGRNPDKLEPLSFRDRKGEDMSEWPADLRVCEWPEGWN